MSDHPSDTPPKDPSNAPALRPEIEAELYALVDSLLDNSISPDQIKRLEAIVIESRAAAVLYYELMHLQCILPFHLSRGVIDLSKTDGTNGFGAAALDESMVLPAIQLGDSQPSVESGASAPANLLPRRTAPSKSSFKRWGSAAAVAAIATGLGVVWHARHRRVEVAAVSPTAAVPAPVPIPPAVLTASAGALFDETSTFKPGAALAIGDTVAIKQGAVELTFASSAVVVIRGPARVRVVDRNRLDLIAGSVAAHVPTSAHGFRIDSPGSSVVDLGTDFGVRSLAGSQKSEVDVFRGTVEAAALDAAGRQISAPVRVVTGQAVQLRVAEPVPTAVKFAPAEFDRDIKTIRMPVRVCGTGVGVAPGAADPNWRIVAVPADPTWKPTPAVVVSDLWHLYAPNTPDGSWVSLSDPQHEVANGEYIFETTADLTGVDPTTLSVQLRLAVDNQVTDIRVNGISTGVSTRNMKADDDFAGYTVTLPTGPWRAGLNRIDVVLLNDAFDGSDKPSFMSLQAAWTASVSPVVLR